METVLNKLMGRQTSAERLFEGLALALDASKILPLDALLPVLLLMQRNAAFTDEEEAAECMSFVIDRLQSHASERRDGGVPLRTLLLETEKYAQTPPPLRAALASWLSVATHDELVDEFSPLLPQQHGATPASDTRPSSGPDGLAPVGE